MFPIASPSLRAGTAFPVRMRSPTMTTLDLEGGFSVHDYRHGLKLLQQDGATMTLANREGFGCPACGEPFERLLVAEDRTLSFDRAPTDPFCVARTEDSLLVLTH